MAYFNNPYGNYNYNGNYNPNYQGQSVSNGFVPIPSEDAARAYPVAHGASVTFRDENLPYIYIKTLGFGQLDSPMFEKYRLVKENTQNPQNQPLNQQTEDLSNYVTKAEFGTLAKEYGLLKESVERLRKELGDE